MPNDFARFDAYLGSQGLIYHHDSDARAETRTMPLRPVRQDSGQHPWETRPESGDVFSQGEFKGGMGQEYFHGPGDDRYRMFLHSRGHDVSRNTLRHDPAILEASATNMSAGMAIANGTLYTATSSTLYSTSDISTFTPVTITGAPVGYAIQALVSNGADLFVALADGSTGYIFRRNSAGAWTTYWGGVGARVPQQMLWAKDRLFFFCNDTNFYEQVASGTANATLIKDFAEGWTVQTLWASGSYIYAAAVNDGLTRTNVYHFGLNADVSAIEEKGSTELGLGILIYAGVDHSGQSLLSGAIVETGNTVKPALFQAWPDATGHLIYAKVIDGKNMMTGTSPQLRADSMVTTEDSVYLYWPTGTGDELSGQNLGLARFNLATGAFTLLPSVHTTAQTVTTNLIRYQGRLVLSGPNSKTWAQSSTVKTTTATFQSSIAHWNNAGLKSWTQINLVHKPLPTGSSVAVYYTTSHPDENSWTLAGTSDTAASTSKVITLTNITSRQFALKLVSTRATDTTLAPEVLQFSVISHPKPTTTEWVLTRHVRIMAADRKDGSPSPVTQNTNTVRNAVMDTAYTSTTLYEPDATWTVRVEQVSDFEPIQPVQYDTGGTGNDEVYYMRLDMIGTRT